MDSVDTLGYVRWLWEALTSPTSTWLQTLLSGAIGAAVGSLATQSVISSHERLARARAELNAANHAMNVCFVIVNQYVGFKRQMVLPMIEAFDQLDMNVTRARKSPFRGEVSFDADLKILPLLEPPVEQLERLVLESVSMGGRGLSAALQLKGVTVLLNSALRERVKLIEKIEEGQFQSNELAALYLGLETKRGADTRFKDNLRAIKLYTDDGIFFAHLTIKDLRSHAIDLIRKHGRKVGSVRRNVPKFDFTTTSANLIPSDSQYADWLIGFQQRQPWWKFWRTSKTGKSYPRSDGPALAARGTADTTPDRAIS